MKKELNNKGFSLVELIIVIAIMAVLMGVLAPQYLKYVKQSKISTDITNAENIATAVNAEIADGETNLSGGGKIKIATSTQTQGTGSNALVSDGARVVYLPACKVDSTYKWELQYDATNGMTKILLGTKQIWPDSSEYEDANKN